MYMYGSRSRSQNLCHIEALVMYYGTFFSMGLYMLWDVSMLDDIYLCLRNVNVNYIEVQNLRKGREEEFTLFSLIVFCQRAV